MQDVSKINETYLQLRMRKGQPVAEKYIADLKQRGLLPQVLDNKQGK